MSKKAIWIFIGIFLALCVAGASYFVYQRGLITAEPKPVSLEELTKQKFSAGSGLSQNVPEYIRAIQALNAGNIEEGIRDLASLRGTYATGTPERNAVEYTIGTFYVSGGNSIAAVDAFKRIVLDNVSYNATTRALSVEGLGRAYWISLDINVLKAVFSGDPYFTKFVSDTKGDYVKALQNLLEDGYHISGTPITAARLAEKYSSNLLNKRYKDDSEKKLFTEKFEGYAKAGSEEIAAFTSLSGYESYRAEFYSIYGAALQNAVLSEEGSTYTKEDVENAYKQSYALAGPRLKPYLIYRYGSFLSVADASNTPAIEDLSKRLQTMQPRDLVGFNVFIKNVLTTKLPAGVFKLLNSYMQASPTFKAYVAEVLKK